MQSGTVHILQSKNVVLYIFSAEMSLLWVIRMLSRVDITAVSSILLIASKIRQCTYDGSITEYWFSGRISRVYLVVYRLFTTVAVVTCAMRWLQIGFWTVPSLTRSWSIGDSGGSFVRTSTIVLSSTYVTIIFGLIFNLCVASKYDCFICTHTELIFCSY